MRKILLFCLLNSLIIGLAAENIYFVNLQGNDANDGETWATAFASVTRAIEVSESGDEIRIGTGTYISTSTYMIDKTLIIKGGYNSENQQNYENKSILDGINQHQIIQIVKPLVGGDVHVKIDGLIFRNGNNSGNRFGAAIEFYRSSGLVSNCVFYDNQSPTSGGGALAFIASTNKSEVINSLFYNNQAKDGGAVFCGSRTDVSFINCTVSENNCNVGEGGGIFSNGKLTLNNTILWGNKKNNATPNQLKGKGQFYIDHNILEGGIAGILPYEVLPEGVIAENFVGIGAQIGGYDNLNQLTGSPTLNDDDWNQMFSRLQYMRPGLVRVIGSEGWNYSLGGVYNPEKSKDVLFKILDFCEANNIKVIWGEWGHVGGTSGFDTNWLNRSVSFLDYLVNTKGYSCVKYFTMVNEPNGTWSSVGGSFELWKNLVLATYDIMQQKGLHSKVQLLAPDVTLSSGAFTGISPVTHPFVTNSVNALGNITGSYDYHLYPANDQVENGNFYKSVLAYKALFPNDKDAIIGEIGFKYYTTSPKGILNEQLKSEDPYADASACMMVYESIYGIDMSAALIQLMLAGYKGSLVWRLDDAMYINSYSGGVFKTNRWGFWNSLGTEKFNNPDDENLRPWFYPTALLSRYFPAGCSTLSVAIPFKFGLFAVASKKDNRYTIALVNTSSERYTFDVKMSGGGLLSGMKQYEYVALNRRDYTGLKDVDGFPVAVSTQNIDFRFDKSHTLTMEPSSFVLLTNME